jgi:hypothetical protein
MAKRLAIPSKELQLYVVGPANGYKASRIQSLNINTDIPSTTIDELGSASHVGDTKDIPNVTLTLSAFNAGVDLFRALTGSAAAYPAAGVDIVNLSEIDAVINVKDPDVSEYVKSCHVRKMQIRDFTYTFTVDGEATEQYTAIGSEKRWFRNDVIVDRFLTGASFTLSQTPVVLKNTNYCLSVIADGDYLIESSTTPLPGEYNVSSTTLTLGTAAASQVMAVYQAVTGPAWADVSDPVQATAIKGKDVKIEIALSGINRVQNVTINGTLNVQPVREMGDRNIIGYQRQVPEITGTLSVLDTDTDLLDLLVNGVATSDTEFTAGEGCTQVVVPLEITLLDPCDTTVPYTVLKTVYLDSIGVTGDSYASTVNQNATQTFNWKSLTAHCVVYSGSR